MYYVYGQSGLSLLIESTNSMIHEWKWFVTVNFSDNLLLRALSSVLTDADFDLHAIAARKSAVCNGVV